MKLRLRLALTTFAVAVPLVAGLGWAHQRMEQSQHEEREARETLTEMLMGGRERCEADPSRFHGRPPHGPHPDEPPPWERGERPPPPPDGPPPPEPPRENHHHGGGHGPGELFAYDAELHPANPAAPALPPELLNALQAANGRASIALEHGRHALVLKMPWSEGPCAIVAAVRPPDRGALGFLPPPDLVLAPMLAVLAALLLSIGPVVGRIRTLTREVRESAQAQYGSALTVKGNDEIAELARAFSEAQGAIREEHARTIDREQALREFLANTTHDVMIPLTALQGHLAQLEAEAAKHAGFDRAELSAAADEAHYLTALVHNLGLTARLENARLELARDPVDLGALLGRATSRHAVLARQHSVELAHAEPPEPLTVQGDLTMLEQAVSNVIANAIVHNKPGGHVAAQLERVGADKFRLTVTDDGPGVNVDELSKLLERGYRADAARSRAPNGQGLGLHITAEVLKRHGWTLTLRRSEFGGLEVEMSGSSTTSGPGPV